MKKETKGGKAEMKKMQNLITDTRLHIWDILNHFGITLSLQLIEWAQTVWLHAGHDENERRWKQLKSLWETSENVTKTWPFWGQRSNESWGVPSLRDVDSSDLMLVSSVRNLNLRKTEKIVKKNPEQKRKETSLEQNLHPRTVRFDSRIQIND